MYWNNNRLINTLRDYYNKSKFSLNCFKNREVVLSSTIITYDGNVDTISMEIMPR